MSTYLELCQKFRKVVGISGTGPSMVTGQSGMNEKITIWVADADELVQRRWDDWKFLLKTKQVITTIADVSTYTVDELGITDHARWRRKYFVSNPGTASYQKLNYDTAYEDYINSDYYLGSTTSGSVDTAIIRDSDNALIFTPTPSAITTVWGSYYKAVTRMEADGSTTPIPTRFEDIIIYRAKMFYAEHLEDVSLYNSAEKDYTEILTKLESSQAQGLDGMQTSGDGEYEDVVVY